MKRAKQLIAVLLSLVMVFSAIPTQAFAVGGTAPDPAQTARIAELVQKAEEENWDETFPFGTFAFANSEAGVEEGGQTYIDVLRMGGTTGRATVYIYYTPSAMDLGNGKYSYGNAAGTDDIRIEVEKALPVAAYQSVGKYPDPEEAGAKLTQEVYTGEDALEGDRMVRLEAAAESWQWQAKGPLGWKNIQGGTEDHMLASADDLAEYDLRCVYVAEGVRYCTDSLNGEVYEKPEPEELPPMPADLELNPEQSFSDLQVNAEDPYRSYVFPVTFADGEARKQLRITAFEDEKSEAIRAGTFTMLDCDGGSLYDTASTLALTVFDNDEAEPFALGFTTELVEADKASGTAKISVKRTGGTQTMVTVDYATEDGTAEAGRDYTSVSGTLAFYADVDELIVEVPLINDGIQTDDAGSFRLKLDNLKGDADGLCTMGAAETTVHLHNTAAGEKKNLATMLHDGAALDASGQIEVRGDSVAPVDPAPVGGTQKTPAPMLPARIIGMDGQDLGLQSYNYGRVQFNRYDIDDYYDRYWTDSAYLKGANPEGGSWNGGYASGDYWKVSSKGGSSATLTIPHFAQKFEDFHGGFNFHVTINDNPIWGAEYTYPYATVYDTNQTVRSNVTVSGDFWEGYHYQWTTYGRLDYSFDIDAANVKGLRIGTARYDSHDADKDAYCEIDYAYCYRRTYANDLRLQIHTANDSGDNGVSTMPGDGVGLEEDSGVYAAMKPEVRLLSGGVTWGGKLYVGSTVQVNLKSTPSYAPYSGELLNAGIYLTRKDGSIAAGPKVTKVANANAYNIEMLWDGMTKADLEEEYTINVVMVRTQDFLLDLTPSVPRLVDEDGRVLADIDPSRTEEAWDLFWLSPEYASMNYVTVGYTEMTAEQPHFEREISVREFHRLDFEGADNDPLKTILGQKNVHWINFGRSAEDRIIYNGRSYAGNDVIWLDVPDFAQPKATFRYYNQAYLNAVSIMTATVNSVGLYWDGNANGKIDGHYDPEIGYFILDEGTEDTFEEYLDEGLSYEERVFAPVPITNEAGETVLAPYFLKISYTMTPRALTPDAGQEYSLAQVLPAFVTNVTDPDNYATLTEEQQSYRYLISGKDDQGNYTSDNHPMYGPEATAVQFVDVPLGGGYGTRITEDGYVWDPEFHGNLLFPFENPEPIFVDNTALGDNMPIASGFEVTEDGQIVMSDEDVDRLNNYLGSFVGNTAIALCIQEQEETTDELMSWSQSTDVRGGADQPNPETKKKKPKPESSTPVPNDTYESSESVVDSKGGAETEEGGIDMEDSGNELSEFNMDLAADMPKFEIGGTDHSFVTLAVSGYEVEVAVSVPLFSYDLLKKESKGIGDSVGDNAKVFGQIASFIARNKSFKDMLRDSDEMYSSGETSSKDFAISFAVSVAFAWKYNSVDNEYCFNQFTLAGNATLEFKVTARLAACPLIYFYLKIGISIDLSTGATVERVVEEEAVPEIGEKSGLESKKLLKGQSTVFATEYKTFNLEFSGKLAIQVFEDRSCSVPVDDEDFVQGFLKSNGGDTQTATLKKTDGMKLDKTYYVRLKAMEDTEITHLARVTDTRSESFWSGVSFAPTVYLQAGAGVGVELCKLELYIKINVGCSMTLGAYDIDEGEYGPFSFDTFDFAVALGVQAVFLFFSYSMDLIGYYVSYENGEGWEHGWKALEQYDVGGSVGVVDRAGNRYGVHISLPGSTSETQKIYSNNEPEVRAIDANDPAVPFQLSGYSSSGDAFKLADGLITGYDYKVVTVGDQNYLIYTISRSGAASALDNSMLVLSRLKLTGVTYGLVNPVDEEDPTPYILLDTVAREITPEPDPDPLNPGDPTEPPAPVTVYEDDGTGDLDFTAWAEGSKLCAAWVSYAAPTESDDGQTAGEAAKRTVIKRAEFDVETGAGFTEARTVSGPAGEAVSLPSGADENVTVYVKSVPMSEAELQAAETGYRAYLLSAGFDPADQVNATGMIGRYRIAYQTALWEINGKSSKLCAALNDGTRSELTLAEGQIVENIECARIGDTYYLAYTTGELRYTDADGNSAADPAQAENLLNVKRLFLRTFRVEDGEIVWTNHGGEGDENKGVLLRTLYDYDNNDVTPDGIYQAGTILPVEEPTFSNLQFLRAKVGESLSGEDEDFTLLEDRVEALLLFGMNGSTYLIREASLESIAREQHGSIIPFFTPGINRSGKQDKATGRDCVTIGADSAGNLAAVYVSTVDNTTNNALYLTKYDPTTGSWGAGTILAMNYMDVYEDAIANNWDGAQREQAFYGKLAGYADGGMDQFQFRNLQIALGTNRNGRDSLLILTQGSMTYLKEMSYELDGETRTSVVPIPDSETAGIPRAEQNPAGVGIYAVSYGVGEQGIGAARFSTTGYDFTAGGAMYVSLQFVNTGDVGIRGSDNEGQRITVRLDAQTPLGTVPMTAWEITENIVPGQTVRLSGGFPMEQTLPAGSRITLAVSEGEAYAAEGGVPFKASLDLMEITLKPELGYEDALMESVGVDENGDTVVSVNLMVGNRGSGDADQVLLQFSYDTGAVDEEGNPIYAPLDLTGHELSVGEQELLPLNAGDDLPNGILSLSNVDAGYGRRVRGSLKVPPELYLGRTTGSLNLRAEIFSGADTGTELTDTGLLKTNHGEYNDKDNSYSVNLEERTFFRAASKVTIPLGNTLHLPVSLSTTTGEAEPRILVTEFADQVEGRNIGILSYRKNADGYSNGSESGTVILVPSATGTGFIRVLDSNTNCFYDIAYSVTDPAEGVNIFIDNGMFTFLNRDGSEYDAAALASTQDWIFDETVRTWGQDGTDPYLNNLSRGRVGSSFTFSTQAERIDLIFGGKVLVESDFPGYEPHTLTANGGDGDSAGEYASVRFGTNATNYTHNVTITVLEGPGTGAYADFDRLIEHFGAGGTPTPAEDDFAPHIYWSRSFPDTASVLLGQQVRLSAYILDDGRIASVSVNDKTPDTLTVHADGCWEVPLTFTENGTLRIDAVDYNGNRTAREIPIDWFNNVVSENSSASAPALEATLVKQVGDETVPLTDDVIFTQDDIALIFTQATASAGLTGEPQVSVNYITTGTEGGLLENPITAARPDYYPAENNGWYMVTARDPDPMSHQWTSVMVMMNRIDKAIPVVTLSEDSVQPTDGGKRMIWSAVKDVSGSPVPNLIEAVLINGQPQTIQTGQAALSGTYRALFGGEYTAAARDSAGNTGTGSYILRDVPIALASGKTVEDLLTTVNADDETGGSVQIHPEVLVGGTYDLSLTEEEKANGAYRGRYEWCVVQDNDPDAEEIPAEIPADAEWTAETELSLAGGFYLLYVRDAQEPENAAVVKGFRFRIYSESITLMMGSMLVNDTVSVLSWEAVKSQQANRPIREVRINGFTATETQGLSLSGMFPLQYAGEYVLTASDGVNTSSLTLAVTPEEAPVFVNGPEQRVDNLLNLEDDAIPALVTVFNSWDQEETTGSVTVDPQFLAGGTYNAETSVPERNEYRGDYEWQLVKLENESETLIADWSTTPTAENLTTGEYKLRFRNVLDGETGMLEIPFRIASEAVDFIAEARDESLPETRDGQITATGVNGGYGLGGMYQYALVPIEDAQSLYELTELPAEENGGWLVFDPMTDPDPVALEGLAEGWYQLTFRTILNTTAVLAELSELHGAYLAAEAALEAASEEERPALEAARDEAKAAYEGMLNEILTVTENSYETYPDLWRNAKTQAICVRKGYLIYPEDLGYPTDEDVRVEYGENKLELSEDANEQLIADNADRDILVSGPGMTALIPAGTLEDGADVSEMVMPFLTPEDLAEGNVIRWTGADGETRYVGWSLVDETRAYYIADRAGKYELVRNDVTYTDVKESSWFYEEVTFIADREIMNGVGEGRFSPNGKMTRAMFVTVLGRLAGVDPEAYADRESGFTDVKPGKWYTAYVIWAAELGIVNGTGNGKFTPNGKLTREQLCTMLVRYLESQGMELAEAANGKEFTDEADISKWALDSVNELRKAGIPVGYPDGSFKPKDACTRAQAAAFLSRVICSVLRNLD